MFNPTRRILCVDLATGALRDETVDPDVARSYVGGGGLAAHYVAEMTDAQTDPLSPDNPLIVMTGPLVGTAMPSAGRYTVCALSPLTGFWGEANSGGFFGPELRFAGYDGIIITGHSDRPVWLSIVDGVASLREADDLWGLDSYATQEAVRARMEDHKARVACIGVAGESLSRMAAVMNDHGRAAARGGLGAVMGSKRLKAIGVRGSQPVPLYDADAFRETTRLVARASREDFAALSLRLAGTAGYVDLAQMYGDMPNRYYQQGEWEAGHNLSGVLLAETLQKRIRACYRCPIGCGRETSAPSYGLATADGPEYETIGAFGSLNLVDDLEAIVYAGHLCNVYGLDTISTGATISLAIEMAQRGLVPQAGLQGLDLAYGDARLIHRLIEMIGRREGLGNLLAEGSARLAAHYGVPELAVVVKGMEVPLHDPRAFGGMAVTYALSPRGACHMQGDMYGVDTGQGAPAELGVMPGDRFDDSREKGRMAARQMAWRNLYNAMILCQFQNPGVELVQRALNDATGWDLSPDDLLTTGMRILTAKRNINLGRGMTVEQESLPNLLTQPLADGGTEGFVPNLDQMLQGAREELGWE